MQAAGTREGRPAIGKAAPPAVVSRLQQQSQPQPQSQSVPRSQQQEPSEKRFACACGREFSVAQAKAAHCRTCVVYNASKEQGLFKELSPFARTQSQAKKGQSSQQSGQIQIQSELEPLQRSSGRQVKRKRTTDYEDIRRSGGSGRNSGIASGASNGAIYSDAEDDDDVDSMDGESLPVQTAAQTAAVAMLEPLWTPGDDLVLVNAVQQYSTMDEIARRVRFSTPVSAADLKKHWRGALLEGETADVMARHLATAPITAVPPVPFSRDEDYMLAKGVRDFLQSCITSDGRDEHAGVPLKTFDQILRDNRIVFHSTRTAKSLKAHWTRRKGLMVGRVFSETPAAVSAPENTEPSANRTVVGGAADAAARISAAAARMAQTPALRQFHAPGSTVATAVETGDDETEDIYRQRSQWAANLASDIELAERSLREDEVAVPADMSFLAVIRGRRLSYSMKTKEVLLGRASPSNKVDLDLSSEIDPHAADRAASMKRISRRQAVIYLKRSGEFFIKNIGRSSVLVDGIPVTTGDRRRLLDRSLLTFGGMPGSKGISMTFDLNRMFFATLQHYVVSGSGAPPNANEI